MSESSTAQPQRREERNGDGALVAQWWVITDARGQEVHHGEFTAFHPNGLRREHGFYDYGQRVGPWYGWAEDGRRIYDKIHDASEITAPEAKEPSPEDWQQPVEPDPPSPERVAKAGLWIELLVVLALAWLPFMVIAALTPDLFVSSSALLNMPTPEEIAAADGVSPAEELIKPKRNRDDVAYIFSELRQIAMYVQVLAVMLFLLWRRREEVPVAESGLVAPRVLRDVAIAAGLLVVATGVSVAVSTFLPSNSFVDFRFYPNGAAGYSVMAVALLLNSVIEELVWRGYVLQRLIRLGTSKTLAIVVSSALFASYHLYQGPNAVGEVFIWGMIYALAFRVIKSIWPLVIAHTAHNVLVYTGAFEALGMRPLLPVVG